MSAAEALEAAQAAGIVLDINGDDLIYEAAARPPDDVLAALKAHKADVVALLRRVTVPSWPALYRERVSHWSLLRPGAEAEQLAWNEVMNRWHMEHGERVRRDLCAGCRKPVGAGRALEIIDSNRVHLDDLDCLIWHGARWRGAATTALDGLGMTPPPGVRR